ncbi:MAG: hypothetical protein AABX03_03875 [Nanoarchaeota archaeon]
MARSQFPQESSEPISYEVGLKISDLEESHKLMKERVLLIGQNLIDSQEKTRSEITNMKKDINELKTDVKRIKDVIESLSEEVSKSARKEELAIIARQFKIFEPLKLARLEDVEKIIDEKIHHHKKTFHENNETKERESETSSSRHEFWRNKI